jgi:long-chain acyl-CoA synthetase
MNASFRRGCTLVLMPRFDGPGAIALMAQEQVTVIHGVPTMYLALVEAARSADHLPTLRRCISGGASLPLVVLERFEELFSAKVFEGYGLSETSPVATNNQPDFGVKPGTVGCAVWGVKVEIARSDIEDRIELLGPGEIGEIVIRGHGIFDGYLDRPEATAAAIVDDWFRSGDIGMKDDEGFITILDRKKDLIIRGGFNVYPREVEETLARHPSVAQVAVIGIFDDRYGEEIVAFVVPVEGQDITAEAFIEWSQERLAKHKYPRRIEVVESLPLGPSGKILKRELSARIDPR